MKHTIYIESIEIVSDLNDLEIGERFKKYVCKPNDYSEKSVFEGVKISQNSYKFILINQTKPTSYNFFDPSILLKLHYSTDSLIQIQINYIRYFYFFISLAVLGVASMFFAEIFIPVIVGVLLAIVFSMYSLFIYRHDTLAGLKNLFYPYQSFKIIKK